MRAIVIDPAERSLREEGVGNHYTDYQRVVGGDIQFAHEFENGDVLYVDEAGLLQAELAMSGKAESARAFFFDVGAHQKFAGRGVIVGMEGDDGRHGPARSSLQEIASRLSFFGPLASAAGGAPN